ncbi:MAG TPA: gluconate 2-dehydrogenase subunit 3 family protein [Mycobacteriales bacterium]|nr:gluconate 2-dehydrogenase subunit 3 family protein [Mycobacteriales bacterium]
MGGLFRTGVGSDGTVPGGGPNLRFPGYDVVATVGTWDAVTAGVVLARLGPPPPIRFFTPDEQAIGAALFDQLLDQRPDQSPAAKVPVLEMVDARLAEHITDGWRYADMPEDGDAFRRTFAALDEDARELTGQRFHETSWDRQAEILQRIQDLNDDDEQWHGLPAKHVWSLWTRYACAAFYSHPWAWNEIGFGGPAYPRGYKNLGMDAREPWEVRDRVNREPIEIGAIIENSRRAAARREGVE